MSNDIDSLLNDMNAHYTEPKAATKASNWDDRFLKYEAGKTYQLRLLWFPTERKTPFVESYIHHGINERGFKTPIACPSIRDKKDPRYRKLLESCPVCKNNAVLYDNFNKKGISSDEALYQKYKRKFRGYALVYVINDPTTPDNNGKVKILQYTIKNQDTLDFDVFGRVIQGTGKDQTTTIREDRLGGDAFKLIGGFDMLLTASQSGEFVNISLAFARRSSDIKANSEDLLAQVRAIKFNDLVTAATPDALDEFYHKFVLADMGNPVGDIDLAAIQKHASESLRQKPAAPAPAALVEDAPAPAPAPKAAPKPAPKASAPAPIPQPDFGDIDDIVNSLKDL